MPVHVQVWICDGRRWFSDKKSGYSVPRRSNHASRALWSKQHDHAQLCPVFPAEVVICRVLAAVAPADSSPVPFDLTVNLETAIAALVQARDFKSPASITTSFLTQARASNVNTRFTFR
ncbi:MAG TPA: hypothetical protein VGG15_03085 [Terriglobales bacterium]|jgi:hypothetical protein